MTKEIHIHVANQPGVLSRVAQVFARRGFNIESLQVVPDSDKIHSYMTVVATGDASIWPQIIKQVSKLVDVIHCEFKES